MSTGAESIDAHTQTAHTQNVIIETNFSNETTHNGGFTNLFIKNEYYRLDLLIGGFKFE